MSSRLVNPVALDAIRELIDCDIAYQRIYEQLSFDWACDRVVADFGLRVRYLDVTGLGYMVWLERRTPITVYPEHVFNIQGRECERAQHYPEFTTSHAQQPRLMSYSSALFTPGEWWWAVSAQDACLSALCLCLDENAPIFYDQFNLKRTIPTDAVQGIESFEVAIYRAKKNHGLSGASKPNCDKFKNFENAFTNFVVAQNLAESVETEAKKFREYTENRYYDLMNPALPLLNENGSISDQDMQKLSPLCVDPTVLEESLLAMRLMLPSRSAMLRASALMEFQSGSTSRAETGSHT